MCASTASAEAAGERQKYGEGEPQRSLRTAPGGRAPGRFALASDETRGGARERPLDQLTRRRALRNRLGRLEHLRAARIRLPVLYGAADALVDGDRRAEAREAHGGEVLTPVRARAR